MEFWLIWEVGSLFSRLGTLHSSWHLIDWKKKSSWCNIWGQDNHSNNCCCSEFLNRTGDVIEAFHKYLHSTNLTRKGLSNLLHRGEPKAHRVRVWFCAEIHEAGKWQLAIDSCSTLLYPLQCCCLENPRDRGAWWAAVCGVAQSQTRLKRLSSSSYTTLGLILLSSQPETYTCLFYSTSPFNIWHFLFLIYLLYLFGCAGS